MSEEKKQPKLQQLQKDHKVERFVDANLFVRYIIVDEIWDRDQMGNALAIAQDNYDANSLARAPRDANAVRLIKLIADNYDSERDDAEALLKRIQRICEQAETSGDHEEDEV